jgi:hypothetical protein
MDGGSGDVECEGISIDGDESEGMGIDVDVDDSKEGMDVGDECKDGTGIGTVKGLGVDYEIIPLAYSQ